MAETLRHQHIAHNAGHHEIKENILQQADVPRLWALSRYNCGGIGRQYIAQIQQCERGHCGGEEEKGVGKHRKVQNWLVVVFVAYKMKNTKKEYNIVDIELQ